MHFWKEWHRRGWALRKSAIPTEKPWRFGMWWRIPHEPDVLGGSRKHRRHLWVWLGQCYHTRRRQLSRVVIPGEREREHSNEAIDIRSSGGAPKEMGGVPHSTEAPVRSNGTPVGSGMLEGWGTPLGEALTVILKSPLTLPDDVLPRVPERDGPLRWSCPHKKNINNPRKPPQRAECPDTWGTDRDHPEAPETDHTQKRTGDKTFFKKTRSSVLLF